MKLTLETLYKDHDNIRRVLCLLERLLIDIYRGPSINYQMIQKILVYLQNYPACVHHPAEYAVFSSISEDGYKNRKFHDDVNNLMKEHIEIDCITRNLIEAVGSKLADTHSDIADIGGELSRLINLDRAHLLFEEVNIYPFIAENLGDEDWEIISALVPECEDPIFGDSVKRGYELIFNAL